MKCLREAVASKWLQFIEDTNNMAENPSSVESKVLNKNKLRTTSFLSKYTEISQMESLQTLSPTRISDIN